MTEATPKRVTYNIDVDTKYVGCEFTEEDYQKLRTICEVLAMLDGNAFFQIEEIWRSYIPEAKSLYESNGGDDGWAGQAEFAKIYLALEKDPELKELYNQFKFLAALKGVDL